jgi:hypothetical protein
LRLDDFVEHVASENNAMIAMLRRTIPSGRFVITS